MSYQLLYPRQVVLVVSHVDNEDNVMTAGWSTPLSFKPPLVGMSISRARHTHGMISSSKEFVVSIPTKEMEGFVMHAGTRSGRNKNKFEYEGITTKKGTKTKCLLINEAESNLECKLVDAIETGDHTLFIGEVVAVHKSKSKKEVLLDLGGGTLFPLSRR